jgi:hypothetical protein
MTAAFFLDENVTERIAGILAEHGFDTVSANRNHKGPADSDLLLVAANLGRIFVTATTNDFLLLHRAWLSWSAAWKPRPRPRHAGILLIHSAAGYAYVQTAGEIIALAENMSAPDDFHNRAFAWSANRGWHEI